MANNRSSVLQSKIASSYDLIQQGQHAQAVDILLPLVQKAPTNADIPHLLALAYKGENNYEMAERYFTRSLSINKHQPQLHNNFGNLLMSAGFAEKAERHYKSAIAAQPEFPDAQRNLAICWKAQKRHSEAKDLYLQLINKYSGVAKLHSGLADCYRELGDYSSAETHYQEALKYDPKHYNAIHNLGLIQHLAGDLPGALTFYKSAYEIAPSNANIVLSLANAIHESGDSEQAIALLTYTIDLLPESIALHERLNEILWEVGETGAFCGSYEAAIEQRPDNVDLRVRQGLQLFRAGRIEQTEQVVGAALKQFPDQPELMSTYGQALADLNKMDEARAYLSKSLNLEFSQDAGRALAKLYLIEGKYDESQLVVDSLLANDKNCQLAWALQSLVWRLQGNPKYAWLCDYKRFVKSFMLEPPATYANLEEFLDKLREVLLSLHKTKAAPLQQTLRGGTQTAARLLHQPIKELTELKSCLANIVAQYISQLPEDSSHPLLARKNDDFEFSGSWSVRLAPDGFHVNHVHPAGWISSSCYIVIPPVMQDDQGLEGAIKFGESPLNLGDREVVEKVLHPKPGMVVLFPSFMWHGTYSFQGANPDYRLTAPFDVIPIV